MNDSSYMSTPRVCLHGVDKENFAFYCLRILTFFLVSSSCILFLQVAYFL